MNDTVSEDGVRELAHITGTVTNNGLRYYDTSTRVGHSSTEMITFSRQEYFRIGRDDELLVMSR